MVNVVSELVRNCETAACAVGNISGCASSSVWAELVFVMFVLQSHSRH